MQLSESEPESEVIDVISLDDYQKSFHEREKERWRESFNKWFKT